ncbi:hypothetical protein [Sporosarcina sp. FSL K6-1508]|uniref:hypothetical protein n=1 Tax=Sporosarcina sp. FSL K6-1508 TaxID=2921553 RepID=UPI0030F8A47C
MTEIKAYMLNKHHIFLDYKELSSIIYDILHFSHVHVQNDCHTFSINIGHIHYEKMMFIDDNGEKIPLRYEPDYDLYFSNLQLSTVELALESEVVC